MSWYKVKILNKEINWASVLASGIIFVSLEVWRRKYIAEQIKKDIKLALSKTEVKQEETQNILDQILDNI